MLITERARIDVQDDHVSALVGSTATLACLIYDNDYQAPMEMWFNGRQMIKDSERHSIVLLASSTNIKLLLTIKNLSIDDYGDYHCEVGREMGKTIKLTGEIHSNQTQIVYNIKT